MCIKLANQRLMLYTTITGIAHMHTHTHTHTAFMCPQLDPPTNGTLSLTNGTFIDSQAFYDCENGFQLVGDAMRVCGAGGWTGNDPACIRKWLDALLSVEVCQVRNLIAKYIIVTLPANNT